MLTVAYLGPEHTNTHVAALKRFGRRTRYVHAPTVDDVFHLVERRQADCGVVPIENSLEGAVTHTLDRFIDFMDTPVQIQGEIEQPIKHYLIVHKGTRLPDLKVVLSHPQALAQCRRWLEKSLHHVHPLETSSTAEAVQMMVDKKSSLVPQEATGAGWKTGRAIAPSERAAIARAEVVKGKKLRAIPIAEERENKTRFLILGLREPKRGLRNKTSILFALKDKPGALHDALMPFKRNRINLTKIESRPSKRKAWEYRSTSMLRVLGSYPVTR
ncbi:MAG: ACT domain-containing protein [Candidatus Omnitrophica bacterium]|nr:ACT domain-containing protein [Candidatus Omnitrophota bacterium]